MTENPNQKTIDLKLMDWQAAEGSTETIEGEPIRQEPHDAQITIGAGRVDFTLPVGAETPISVWIEIENGKLKVHAYDTVRDEPVNLIISADGIEIDTFDRDQTYSPASQ